MLRHRILRLAGASLIATAMVIAVLPGVSGAAVAEAVGYWSRPFPQEDTVEAQSANGPVLFNSPTQDLPVQPPVPLPPTTIPGSGPVTTIPTPVPPPTVPVPVPAPDPGQPSPFGEGAPEGGFWVANDATGAMAISALRFRGDVGSARLTIDFAPGSTTVGSFIACPALSDWEPETNGSWNNRPAHDCDRFEITGKINETQTGIQFDIPQGFSSFGERQVDIMILPNRLSGDTFSVFFQPITDDSLEVFGGQDLPNTDDDIGGETPTDFDTDFSTPGSSSGGSSSFGGGSFDSGSEPGFSGGGSAVAAPDTVNDVTTSVVSGGGGSGPVPEVIADFVAPFKEFTESRVGRIISITLLFGLGAIMFWLGGAPAREPRLIGGLATANAGAVSTRTTNLASVRGIGRFRATRVAKPERL